MMHPELIRMAISDRVPVPSRDRSGAEVWLDLPTGTAALSGRRLHLSASLRRLFRTCWKRSARPEVTTHRPAGTVRPTAQLRRPGGRPGLNLVRGD